MHRGCCILPWSTGCPPQTPFPELSAARPVWSEGGMDDTQTWFHEFLNISIPIRTFAVHTAYKNSRMILCKPASERIIQVTLSNTRNLYRPIVFTNNSESQRHFQFKRSNTPAEGVCPISGEQEAHARTRWGSRWWAPGVGCRLLWHPLGTVCEDEC